MQIQIQIKSCCLPSAWRLHEFSSTTNALEKKFGSEILHFQIEFPGTDRFDRCVILNGLFQKIVFLQQQLECQKEYCNFFLQFELSGTIWDSLTFFFQETKA